MCRNIKTLFNFDPPATDEEIRDASLQYVRKVTGFNKPSKTNEEAFYSAVEDIRASSATSGTGCSPRSRPPRRPRIGKKRRPRRKHAQP